MPPRFDRDVPNPIPAHSMPNVAPIAHQYAHGSSNGICNGNGNVNNQLMNGNNVNNGGIGNVAASLRKPLLEINGAIISI
jgi:hypothetical protein